MMRRFPGCTPFARPVTGALVALLLLALPAGPARAASEWDITRIGLVWQVPEMARVQVRTGIVYDPARPDAAVLDLYLPEGAPAGRLHGAVVFVNGVGDLPDNPLRRWQIYSDWARAVAARGMAGIVYGATQGQVAGDLETLFRYLAEHGAELGVDPARLGLFACSANVTPTLPFLATPMARPLRCAALYYGATAVDSLRPDLPVLYVKAQKDGPQLNAGIDQLWQRARERHLPWSMVVARGLPHAFDALSVTDDSRALVQQTLEFWRSHLQPLPPAPDNSIGRQVNARIYGQEWGEAARLLEPIHQAGGAEPDVARLLLLCYRNQRDFARGIPLAEEQVRLHPEQANFRSSYGLLLSAAGRENDAVVQLEKAVELGARDFFTFNQVLMSELSVGRTAEAVRYGKQAAALFPGLAGIHYNLACAYARNNQSTEAIESLATSVQAGYRNRAAIEADPDLASLHGHPRYRAIIEGLAE